MVLVFVAVEPEVLPLVAPEAVVPALASVLPEVVPELVVGDVVSVVPLAVVPPVVVPLVAGVDPGCTMAPPLAPSVPPVVAPEPVGAVPVVEPEPLTELSVDSVPLVVAEVLDWLLRVPLLVAVCAIAPPATKEATKRPRSLLMLDLRVVHARRRMRLGMKKSMAAGRAAAGRTWESIPVRHLRPRVGPSFR